jgi:putative nucleotidyltransferase with HDIG domain
MALDINKGQIIDQYKGQEDLKGGIIRTVGNPDDRFGEDALRMLRAVRFSAELGFTINMDTMNSLINNANLMSNVSRERIKDEFTKIIMSDNPMIGLNIAQKTNILKYISPVFEEMLHVEQNKEAHKYDVWEHSLRTLQHAADKGFSLEVRFAALFHDIAKPATKREVGGNTTFYGHEVVGANVTRETLKNLTYSNEIVEKATKLVRWHMFFSDTEEITHSAVRRLIRKVGQDSIWDLMDLRKCDRIGTGRPKEQPYRLRKFQSMIDEVLRDPISVGMLKLNGDIMINELHMKPGKKIGYVLHALLEEVLDDPSKNEIDYQKERAQVLYKLEEDVLKEMGEKAMQTKEEAEEKELKTLKEKRFVK